MPFGKYLKPLEANRFGACMAVGHNQLRSNAQNYLVLYPSFSILYLWMLDMRG
jgi:hypothetical protein